MTDYKTKLKKKKTETKQNKNTFTGRKRQYLLDRRQCNS